MVYDEETTKTLEGWRQEDAAAGDWERVLRITAVLSKRAAAEHHVDAGTDKELEKLWALLENSSHGCGECPHATDCIGTAGVAPPQKCPHEFCGWRRRLAEAKAHVDAGTIAEGRDAMDAAENRPPPENPPQAVTLRDDPPTATTTTTWECNTCALPCVLCIKHATWTKLDTTKPECCPVRLRHSTWKLSPPEDPPVAAAEATAASDRQRYQLRVVELNDEIRKLGAEREKLRNALRHISRVENLDNV